MKKERPILFNSSMVQAILAGRKTQTRRIAKVPVRDHFGKDIMDWDLSEHPYTKDGEWLFNIQTDVDDYEVVELKCPYGQMGDVLFVRENWKLVAWDFEHDSDVTMEYADGDQEVFSFYDEDDDSVFHEDRQNWTIKQVEKLHKKGITEWDERTETYSFTGKNHPLSPSIHLPKWCSRIWLEITGIRVERLQDITGGDAIAEGIDKINGDFGINDEGDPVTFYWMDYDPVNPFAHSYSVDSFKSLWQSINGPESWDANPWVWILEFKRINRPT